LTKWLSAENFQSIKDGNPSEEILGALRNGLYEL